MHQEDIRLAPEWCGAKWFQKPKEERLAFLGLRVSPEKSRALEFASFANTDRSPAVNERPRASTMMRFREMVKSAAAEYALEDTEDPLSASILNSNVGNHNSATDTDATRGTSGDGEPKSCACLNETTACMREPEEHTATSKWTQMAMFLQDLDGCQHLEQFCQSPQPSPRQQPRCRWTKMATDLLHTDTSLSLAQEDAAENVFEDQGSCDTFLPSEIFFKSLFGPEFEIPVLYKLINPPIIPSSMVRNDALKCGMLPVVLGRGSFGRVIRAKLTDSHGDIQNIVVKEIFDCKNQVDAILDEARVLLYLSRTGYVPLCFGVVSNGGVGGAFGILMECVGDGLTLERYLWDRKGRLAPICLLHIARQLAEGLREIHNLGVLLNDIKANNVLLDNTSGIPKVKYCDFGQARYGHGVTISGRITDKRYLYLAPEVRNGGVSCLKSDVYSVGFLFMILSDFGGFNALVPAVKRCIVEDISLRINAEDLAVMTDKIFNDHLEIYMLADGRIQTNLERIAFDNGDMTAECRSSKMGIVLDENENVLHVERECRPRIPTPRDSLNSPATHKNNIEVSSESITGASDMDLCSVSKSVYEANTNSSLSPVSSEDPSICFEHGVRMFSCLVQRCSAPCLSVQYDADDEQSGDISHSKKMPSDDELSGGERQSQIIKPKRPTKLHAYDELSCDSYLPLTTVHRGRCSVSPCHVSLDSLEPDTNSTSSDVMPTTSCGSSTCLSVHGDCLMEDVFHDPLQFENFESMVLIILFIVFIAVLLKLYIFISM